MERNLYKFGMDWLNGVLPVTDVWEVFQMLEKFSSKLRFDRWELLNSGKYNYSRRYCLDGKSSIQIMWNPVSLEEAFTACVPEPKDDDDMEQLEIDLRTSNNPYVFFSISGDGIRYLHSLGGEVSALNKLLFYFYRNNFRASRFDVYCDILDKDNSAVPIIDEAFGHFIKFEYGKPTLVTHLRRADKNCRIYPHYDINGEPYCNYELGGHGSRFGMFRCYNKLDELRQGRLSYYSEDLIREYGASDYWYRLEYEMHKENADSCFKTVLSAAEADNVALSFEDIFASCLNRVFYIVDLTNMNIASCKRSSEWQQFCDLVNESAIDLVQFAPVPYVNMSKSRMIRYIRKNSVFVYAMLVTLFLNENFTRSVLKDGSTKFSERKKYNELRDELNPPGWMDMFVSTQFNRASRTISNW